MRTAYEYKEYTVDETRKLSGRSLSVAAAASRQRPTVDHLQSDLHQVDLRPRYQNGIFHISFKIFHLSVALGPGLWPFIGTGDEEPLLRVNPQVLNQVEVPRPYSK